MKRKLILILLITALCALPSQAQPAHTHLLDGGTVLTAATCKKPGETVYCCLDPDCDYTLTVKTPAQHCCGEVEMMGEATCEGKGWGRQTCTVCGARKNIAVEHKGHHMVLHEVTQEVTCIKGGSAVYICSECGMKERVDYPASGHRLDGGTVETEPTCTKTGVCRYSCTVDGCAYSVTDRLERPEHDWDEGTVTKEATTKSNGAKVCTCWVCGTVRTLTIPRLTEESKPE